MAQILKEKEKQKYKTIDEIAPKWSICFDMCVEDKTKIKHLLYSMAYNLKIHSYDRCFVGEAHGFSQHYQEDFSNELCAQCYEAAGDFPSLLAKLFMDEIKEDWREDKLVKDFEAHWNSVHVK